jgi:MarR family multiple antibiotic resistance transcriptional regulator
MSAMSAPATPPPAHDGIGDQLMELLNLQLRFRRRMQDALGVDAAGLMTMIHLAEVGSDTPTAIAHTLEASTAATSLVLNRLEASGHISRQPHPLDRRKVVVMPVAASIASAYARAKPVIGGVEQLTAELTSDERSTVSTFLEGLVAVYDEALRDGR